MPTTTTTPPTTTTSDTPANGPAAAQPPARRNGRRAPSTAAATNSQADQAIQGFRQRIVDRIWIEANKLRPHPKNWRDHPKGQRSALEGILEQIGFAGSLLVRELAEPDGQYTHELINGHLRTEIAGKRVVPVDVCDLDDGETLSLLTVYDPVGTAAEINKTRLAELLNDVTIRHAGMRSIVEAMAARCRIVSHQTLDPDARDARIAADRAGKLAKKWGTARGQVWLVTSDTVEGGRHHRLMCGDALSATDMAHLAPVPVDMGFTSPPYNMKTNSKFNDAAGRPKYRDSNDAMTDEEYLQFLIDAAEIQLKFCRYFFCNVQSIAGNKIVLIEFLGALKKAYCDTVIWDKMSVEPAFGYRVMNSRFEFVHVFSASKGSKGESRAIGTKKFRGAVDNVFQFNPNGKNQNADVHRAVFPLELASHFIENFTNPGETVLDCFMGIGATMLAAERSGRLACGMEIDPGYVAVQLERAKESGLKVKLEK